MDCGDYVIVTNSRGVKATGRKEEQVLFRKHSMFPGGLKETPYKDMKDRHPDEVRVMSYSSYIMMLMTHYGTDHPACSVGHVTKKQAA